MTSVFYEDIKLSDASIVSIEKCESLSRNKERVDLDKKRRNLLSRIAKAQLKEGKVSAYQ